MLCLNLLGIEWKDVEVQIYMRDFAWFTDKWCKNCSAISARLLCVQRFGKSQWNYLMIASGAFCLLTNIHCFRIFAGILFFKFKPNWSAYSSNSLNCHRMPRQLWDRDLCIIAIIWICPIFYIDKNFTRRPVKLDHSVLLCYELNLSCSQKIVIDHRSRDGKHRPISCGFLEQIFLLIYNEIL